MTPLHYRYDGSFDGLLSAFSEALERGERTVAFQVDTPNADGFLFADHRVCTSVERAEHLVRLLSEAGGPQTVATMMRAYLAEMPDIEAPLFAYVCLTLERRQCLDGWRNQPAVQRVTAAAARFGREVHRFKGLLRFAELADGTFYAAYTPDHNISLALSAHFRQRLRDRRWIIHDRRRNLAVLWNGHCLHPTPLDDAQVAHLVQASLTDREQVLQELWRDYHRRIAIASRANPALQRAFMPKKYWHHLTEMQPPSAGTGRVPA